jgi:predicted amidohydrolase YtcJ
MNSRNYKSIKWPHTIPLLMMSLMLYACNTMKEHADLVVTNANIYTVNENFERASALAVKDGLFVAIGSVDDIMSRFDADHIIDAGGKHIYPGFIDGHCHFTGYGENLYRWADLKGCKSFDEVLDRLDDHLASHPSEWLLGRGWDQNEWNPPLFPDNEQLEERFPGKMILLIRVDGHASLASKSAIDSAGIGAGYKVQGGEVLLNKQGQPSGLLIDNADLAVKELIPELTTAERRQALLEAQQNCFAVGLTGVVDAGLPISTIELIQLMQQEGSLRMKINAMINPDEQTLNRFLPDGPFANERLRINTVKMFADGALGSRAHCCLNLIRMPLIQRDSCYMNQRFITMFVKRLMMLAFK